VLSNLLRRSGLRALLRIAALACLLAGTTAAALDYTPHGTQPGLSWALEPASTCMDCHRSLDPANDSFMPHSSWGGSMMANATRDPLFWAALDIANHDAQSIGKPGVGDYCLRCHTPAGWLKGDVVKDGFGTPPLPEDRGAQGCQLIGNYSRRDYESSDYSGVDCHFCHRLTPTGPAGEPLAIGNANVWLDDSTSCTNPDGSTYGGPCRRGPYPYTSATDPLQPPHGWTYSKHHTESQICGSCHDVSTPDTDEGPLKTLVRADGSDSGRPFPVQRTFTEWNRSLFSEAVFRDGFGDAPAGVPALATAQTCQDCHMRNSVDPLAKACDLNPSGSRTGNLPVHQFVGANTWMPAAIKGEYGVDLQRPEDFDQTIDWARATLQSSATVSAAIVAYQAPAGPTAGTLSLSVSVTNLSGHKLPTGYVEGRRMWIHVQVLDSASHVVAESGAYDAASALLVEDAQARVYESVQGTWDSATASCKTAESGRNLFHSVLADCIAKDNRIPPLGFRPATATDPAGEEVGPVGQVYPETSPGSGMLVNVDVAQYAFALPASSTGPFTATATLRYQTSSRDYIEFLRDEAVANATPAENTLCAGIANRPFSMGPQGRSRGEFAYQLWNNAADDASQHGYGKSPPEAVAMTTVTAGRAPRRRR